MEKEENVVILSGKDEYTVTDNKGHTAIKNITSREYQATRKSDRIQPHIYYNNVITLDKASGGKAQYRNVNNPMVFHDDSKVCYFNIYLSEKGKKAKTEFHRTYTDPAYFTKVFLQEEYPVRNKTVTFNIPASMSRLKLIDCNFRDLDIKRDDKISSDGSITVTYTINNMPETKDEPGTPHPLVAEPYILVAGYFQDVSELYKWHHERSIVDESIPDIDILMNDIVPDSIDKKHEIGEIYNWVQKNIRYVAYEEGDAGYRPDAPAEVVRKRYGDCKGMSMLLATLLRHKGYDAHVASAGTNSIPFRIEEIASLAATDHMICVTYHDGDTLYLDATNEYIPTEHIPGSIQGKDVLVDRGDSYELYKVPQLPASASSDTLTYEFTIVDGALAGVGERRFTGDMKEFFQSTLHAMKKDLQHEALIKSVIPASHTLVDPETLYYNPSDNSNRCATIVSAMVNDNAVTAADNRLYVELNTTVDPFAKRIDTTDRTNDYKLPFRFTAFRSTQLTIPDNYIITDIPGNFKVELPQGFMSCNFARNGNKVTLTKTMTIENPYIPLAEITQWNKAVSDWNNACNQQIELTLKK